MFFPVVLIRLPNNDEQDTDNEMLLLFSYATVTGWCPACPPLTSSPSRSPVDFLTYFLKRSRTFQSPLDDGTMPVLELEDLA